MNFKAKVTYHGVTGGSPRKTQAERFPDKRSGVTNILGLYSCLYLPIFARICQFLVITWKFGELMCEIVLELNIFRWNQGITYRTNLHLTFNVCWKSNCFYNYIFPSVPCVFVFYIPHPCGDRIWTRMFRDHSRACSYTWQSRSINQCALHIT